MPRDPPVTSATRSLSENRSLNMSPLPDFVDGFGRGDKTSQGRDAYPLACGRGWTRCEASRTGEGSVSADRDPSSGAPPAPFSHKGRREVKAPQECYAASTRRKPFHIAVAAPEVSTGRMRVSW